jgi:hypothetical protein
MYFPFILIAFSFLVVVYSLAQGENTEDTGTACIAIHHILYTIHFILYTVLTCGYRAVPDHHLLLSASPQFSRP